jgi:beta-phosphoglucomutase family hydrolase
MDVAGYGAIWDIDGTLVDTAELHFDAWKKVCAELGRPFTRADFAATFGRRNPEILHELFDKRFTAAEVDKIGFHKEELYRHAALEKGITLLPGVRPLLKGLRQAGFRQAVGSSAPRQNVDLILKLTETASFFSGISAMEDTQRGKPDPQVFLIAAEHIGMSPARCVVFEDAVAGIQAARAGGMRAIAVTFVGHHPEAKFREAGADKIVRTLEQLDAGEVERVVSSR